ncbi:hypothetical protein D3C76_1515560 [compost metagenome]
MLVADPQAEQAADRARVVGFADAHHRVPIDDLEQAIALTWVEFADINGITGLGDLPVIGQQAANQQRLAGVLHSAFDQVVGVFGGADQA